MSRTAKTPPRIPRTLVGRDGLVARRMERVYPPDEAQRLVRALENLPTILGAWSQPAGRAGRRQVCWLPASAAAHDAMVRAFLDAESERARAEGVRFVWRRTTRPGARACHNPRSGRSWWVVRVGEDRFRCDCPRYAGAGVCKHVLDAALRRRFETDASPEAVQ